MIQTMMLDNIFAAGDDWPSIPFAVVQDSDQTTPVPITGWNFGFLLSSTSDYQSLVFAMLTSPSNGISIVSASGGTGAVAVLAAQSVKCVVGKRNPLAFYWKLLRTDMGTHRTLGYGALLVRA